MEWGMTVLPYRDHLLTDVNVSNDLLRIHVSRPFRLDVIPDKKSVSKK